MDKNSHRLVIDGVLDQFNHDSDTPYTLKGGTALMKCYGLDRFSEDIDLDAAGQTTNREEFFFVIEAFCKTQGFTYRIGKNTDTVQRAFINYGDDANPLKVEVSYRRAQIPDDLTARVNNTKVYKLDALCQQKTAAYLSRDKMRDLYDVTFICSEHFDKLSEASRSALQNAFEYKDLSQLDYLIKTQDDPLIDKDLLVERFLAAYDKVGLLSPGTPSPAAVKCEKKPITPARSQAQAQRSATVRNNTTCRPTPPGRSR